MVFIEWQAAKQIVSPNKNLSCLWYLKKKQAEIRI